MSQKNLIDQMSDEQLQHSLFMSQFILFSLALLLSIFLFDHFTKWLDLFSLNIREIMYYGCLPGLLIVLIDIVLMYLLPKEHFDDGGINQKIFKNRSVPNIFMIALIVAVSEELLFRGVIHTIFGYAIASTIFALVHVRYLKKPVLLISVLLISFYIGYLYELTNNLLVTITAHFIVDFLLGLIIRYKIDEVIA